MTLRITLLSIKELEAREQGIPRYIRELYQNLMDMQKAEDISVKKFYFPYIGGFGDALSFELGSIFNRIDDTDILHIPAGFFIVHRLLKGAKVISTVHDTNPISASTKNFGYLLKDRIWRYIALKRGIRYNMRISDAIIVDSSQTRREVIDLGFDKRKVFVVNLGLDKHFLNSKIKIIKSNRFSVGYIGSFAINKNVNFILESAKILNNKTNFYLWGAKTYDYLRLLENGANLKTVKFMGPAPENRILNIYDSFDVFVFPSLYEGFGLPILEAQSRGLPVIIYKYGKIPKEVRKYCFEAESPEHMAQIINDLKENGYNEKQKKKATEYARSFTWERCARETLEVYRKVLT